MTSVPNLPRSRQGTRSAAAVLGDSHTAAQENLTRAFLTFTQAAGSPEKSYSQLQAEVARLHVKLQRVNSELERSLEDNARVRGYLARVMENLPCGVMVASADGVQIINPEARQWITHLQAGLRTLSATMTNVVDVYINYLRRNVNTG